jgi:hypothetical protein
MNTVVVYASHFGNAERLARGIAATLNDFGATRLVPVDLVPRLDLDGVDVLITASPTEAFQQMPQNCHALAVKQLCSEGHGSAVAPSGKLLVLPESFFVQRVKGAQGATLLAGEEERAVQWAVKVHETYETAHPAAAVYSL